MPNPQTWSHVELVSDLHLSAATEATTNAFLAYLDQCQADALFILGDLFEVWVGDDAVLSGDVADRCAQALGALAQRGCALHFMAGNRDFLLGDAYARRCHMQRLPDPWTLDLMGRRWLLSHGDAWCLDDHAYQQWRATVRAPGWADMFLALPLAEREAFALRARQASIAHQGSHDAWADVDHATARSALRAAGASALIHGHTHRPGRSSLGDCMERWVLSDWDASATPARLEALRIDAAGVQPVGLGSLVHGSDGPNAAIRHA